MTRSHTQRLRGLGRAAYRMGTTAPRAVTFTSLVLCRDLNATERGLVLAGWRDERREAVAL